MADNIYKNSDPYKREIDKLTSTSNEINKSIHTKVDPEKDTKESKNVDKKGSTFENGSSNDIKSIVFGLFALIGFLIIVYSIFIAVIGEPLASVADTVFIAALIGSFTLVSTIVGRIFLKK
jgi:cytochrome b subunit of formate dehydrogenase